MGYHNQQRAEVNVVQRNVDFTTIPTQGKIGKLNYFFMINLFCFLTLINFFFSVIEGYLKTEFSNSVGRNGISSYGIGAIGNGEFKLTVQITNFVSCAIKKTTAVRVTGTITINNGNFIKNLAATFCIFMKNSFLIYLNFF